jgi:hypothetical protein
MKNNKLVEILSLSVFVFIALHFFIFPGLASNNFFINVVSLTSFFMLIVFVFFGGIVSGMNKDSEE